MAYRAPRGRGLRQGDVLSGVTSFSLTSLTNDEPRGELRTYTHSLVVTQACDLEQDFRARFGESVSADKKLFGVLLCGAYEDADVRAGTHRDGASQIPRKQWDTVLQNKDPRYQNLGFVPGLQKKLVADFKDFFLVPGDYVYALLEQGTASRVAELDAPWRDHALQRFCAYLMRVGLPVDFDRLEKDSGFDAPFDEHEEILLRLAREGRSDEEIREEPEYRDSRSRVDLDLAAEPKDEAP